MSEIPRPLWHIYYDKNTVVNKQDTLLWLEFITAINILIQYTRENNNSHNYPLTLSSIKRQLAYQLKSNEYFLFIEGQSRTLYLQGRPVLKIYIEDSHLNFEIQNYSEQDKTLLARCPICHRPFLEEYITKTRKIVCSTCFKYEKLEK